MKGLDAGNSIKAFFIVSGGKKSDRFFAGFHRVGTTGNGGDADPKLFGDLPLRHPLFQHLQDLQTIGHIEQFAGGKEPAQGLFHLCCGLPAQQMID